MCSPNGGSCIILKRSSFLTFCFYLPDEAFDSSTETVACNCMKFEFIGVSCCRALKLNEILKSGNSRFAALQNFYQLILVTDYTLHTRTNLLTICMHISVSQANSFWYAVQSRLSRICSKLWAGPILLTSAPTETCFQASVIQAEYLEIYSREQF